MKFAIGMIIQESNTFCPCKTTLEHFQNGYLGFGEKTISDAVGTETFYEGVIDAARELGVQLVPTLVAIAATPYGTVDETTFNYLTDALCQRVDSAGSIDGVVLCLHGGMVAENTFDPEGEILFRVRELIGPDVPISCTLDMHCNVSQRMVDNATAFFFNNENPHRDSYARGAEATQALYRIVKGELEPVMVLKKPGMLPPTLQVNPPHAGPMVGIFQRAFEMEQDPRVINVNVGVGFPWSDVPDAGVCVLPVVNRDRALAEELAEELSQRLWEARQDFIPSLVSVEEAVERAMQAKEGPVILADVADNPGDGTTEDSVAILKALIERGCNNVGVALIHDPGAVEQCISAGVGNQVTLDLGHKAHLFGEPLRLTGRVSTITDGTIWSGGHTIGSVKSRLGRTVVLDKDGIEIIISERTHNPLDPEVFRRHGIEPSRMKILAVKTFKMHMEALYGSFAKEFIEVDAPGQASPNLKRFEWRHIPRPMFPIDDV